MRPTKRAGHHASHRHAVLGAVKASSLRSDAAYAALRIGRHAEAFGRILIELFLEEAIARALTVDSA